MGMSIDEHIEVLKSYSHGFTGYAGNLQNSINVAIDTMHKYQMFQTKYVERLKADLKAILVELQLEIEELDVSDVVPEYQDGAEETKEYIANMIEEKINSLEED